MSDGTIMDADAYGRENQDDTALTHLDDGAISMMLLTWLTSKKGDFLKYPEMGGILDNAVFKEMTEEKIEDLRFDLKTEIYLVFSEFLELTSIDIVNHYEQRYLH